MKRPNDGLKIRGLVARTNVALPPPTGPARTQHCIDEGLSELYSARTASWQAEMLLRRALAGSEVRGVLPDGAALQAGKSASFVAQRGAERVREWFALRDRAFDYFRNEFLLGNAHPYQDYRSAGALLRSGLHASGRSFLWLKDAALDIEADTVLGLGRSEPTLGDLLHDAHCLVHRLGEIFGGLYGCKLVQEDGTWFQECAVHLPHVPLAHSMGFSCRYTCTVCGGDSSSCPHIRGVSYDVQVKRSEGPSCSACERTGTRCLHSNGETVPVAANVMITDIELREISFVRRARDPLARITSIEVEASELASRLGRVPGPKDMVLCHTCMYPCQHGHSVEGAAGPGEGPTNARGAGQR